MIQVDSSLQVSKVLGCLFGLPSFWMFGSWLTSLCESCSELLLHDGAEQQAEIFWAFRGSHAFRLAVLQPLFGRIDC